MIVLDLCCDQAHRFEGWFRSAGDFDDQLKAGLIDCPQCDSHQVRRVPSAVAIGSHRAEPAIQSPSSVSSATGSGVATTVATGNSQILGLYRQLVQAVMSHTEDVGSDFATEARKIHFNEAPERAIRGHTTPEEREALREDGIEVIQLPLVSPEDLN